jgi:guanylate kinase
MSSETLMQSESGSADSDGPAPGTAGAGIASLAGRRRGVLLIVASPSGAGKSTLSKNLLQVDHDITLSVSVTTRERRPSEIDGVHYHFIPQRRFEAMRDAGELLEHAHVHGNYYGTPREPVEAAIEAGRDVLFDIDYQGTLQLYEKLRGDIASVFILPPDAAELKTRLERRADTPADAIRQRLRNARIEISHWVDYDYVIVNDDLNNSFRTLQAILGAERARRGRLVGLPHLIEYLDKGLEKLS